ncbi:MAG: ACP phosphodiesterase [Bryobacterales bacterium]|nr:ACP phosphodiesterase [Bryobacterales bacterium]MDE0622385.1 ACP phosphodiesterase [Bryobacterales bacterium]
MAHLLLAGDDPEAKVGQVLADFVTASDIAAFAPGIQAGIRAHQRIDSFADGHPVFARARRRLKPPYRRFGGVLLDIYFDHFLARRWDRHGDGGSLEGFADRTYRILNDFRDLPSARFRMVVAAMCRDNWLVGYASFAGVDRALTGLSKRFPRTNPLASGGAVLREQYAALEADFQAFFPSLAEYARSLPPAGRE